MADQELSAAEAAAVAGAGTGGGTLDLNKPKPGTVQSRLVQGYIVYEKANAQGEWEIDASRPAQPFLPGTAPAAGAPHTLTLPGGQGILQWNPQDEDWYLIKGSATPEKPQYLTSGPNTIAVYPDGRREVIATDQTSIAQGQAGIDLARDQYHRGVSQDTFNNRLASDQFTLSSNADVRATQTLLHTIEAQRAANELARGQLEETQQGNRFNQQYKAFIDLPYQQVQDERAAQAARLGAAAQAGTYGVQRASEGRQAGADVVSTMLATLPYRASPEWDRQYLAAHNAEIAGRPMPAYTEAALGFKAPDFEGARAQANAQAQAQLPTYGQLVQGAPTFPNMDPEEAKRLQRMLMGLPYRPEG